jgi:hypothetical protein
MKGYLLLSRDTGGLCSMGFLSFDRLSFVFCSPCMFSRILCSPGDGYKTNHQDIVNDGQVQNRSFKKLLELFRKT